MQPYIESATALSDYINYAEIAKISGFCQVAGTAFHRLARQGCRLEILCSVLVSV